MAKKKRNNTQISTISTKDQHAKTTKHYNPNQTKETVKNDNAEKPWSKSKKKRMRKLLAGGGGTDHRDSHDQGLDTNVDATHRNGSNKNKRKKVPKSKNQNDDTDRSQQSAPSVVHQDEAVVADNVAPNTGKQSKPKSALQQAFHARLLGARFRELNEELYTTTSSSALTRFQENPELFEQYHQGFRTQVKSWSMNPVDVIVRWLITLQKQHASKSGGNAKKQKTNKKQKMATQSKPLTVADFGCGDAMLARKLLDQTKRTKGRDTTAGASFIVHSFDLVSNGNPLITPCDMSDVPLDDGTVDVGIFSLALMGTNIADFIREAHRVLKPDGTLKIAEVRSRFETTIHTDAGDDGSGAVEDGEDSIRTFDQTLLKDFLHVMRELGFYCGKTDRSNRMFFLMDFKKTGSVPCKKATFTAKPCIYKRR